MKMLISVLAITFLSNFALAFETGKFECISENANQNGDRTAVTVLLSKVSLKTEAGNVTLPYMEYSFDNKNGDRAYAKGIAQVNGDSMSNSFDAVSIQIDTGSFKIVFKDGQILSRIGPCHKIK